MKLVASAVQIRVRAVIVTTLVLAALAWFAAPPAEAQTCMTAPTFDGLESVVNPANATCTLRLTWNPATSGCGGTITYSIYRSTIDGFTPSAANRIASDVLGTTYDDNADLVSGTRYHYVVRARSSANWIEDTNLDEIDGTASYEWKTTVVMRDDLDLDRPLDPSAFWILGAFTGDNDGSAQINIANDCGGGRGTAPNNAYRFGQAGQCNKYSSKEESAMILGGAAGFNVPASVEHAKLSFWHRYNLEPGKDGARLMYSLAGPTTGFVEIPDVPATGEPWIEVGPYEMEIATPIGLRRTWSGRRDAWTQVVVNIEQLTGKTVWFFWRISTDNNNSWTAPVPANQGYWFDDIQVDWTVASGSCTTCPGPVKQLTARAGSYADGSGVQRGSVKLEWTAGPGATVWLEKNGSFLAYGTTGPSGYGTYTDLNLDLGSGHTYSASVEFGGRRSNGKSVAATPRDSTGPVKWAYRTGAASFAPQTISGAVYTVSNDRAIHSVQLKTAGGDWPRSPSPKAWTPNAMNAPAQGRSPVLDVSAYPIGGSSQVVFVSSLDGRLYCFDANTGAMIWSSAVLGDMIVAAPGMIFRQYGSTLTKDLLIVGTRNSSTASRLYALDAATGIVQWTFTNGGGTTGIGIIAAMPTVDTPLRRIYFTSYRMTGGSQNTVWAIDFTETTATLRWASQFGDAATTPWRRGTNVLVGNNNGQVASFAQNATGTVSPLWTFSTGDGAVKTGVVADRLTGRIYFSTTNRVWCVVEGAATETWKTDGATAISFPSSPTMRGTDLFVGSSNGDLVKIAAANTATPGIARTALGGGAVGPPSIDFQNILVHVGTENGTIFAVTP